MAQILLCIGDRDSKPDFFKDGDPILIVDDGYTWGRRQCRDVWISEGLAGVDGDGVDRSSQTAANWPGGFFIVRVTGTTAAQISQYAAAHADGIQQRAYTVDTSGINLANGSVTATLSQIRARITLKGS